MQRFFFEVVTSAVQARNCVDTFALSVAPFKPVRGFWYSRPEAAAQDEDGSGYITVDELRKGLSRCSVDTRATNVQVGQFRV